jgi:hypothetical protein
VATGAEPISVAVSGNYAYVANYDQLTLQVINLACSENFAVTVNPATGQTIAIAQQWINSGNNMYNANTGNVGIGTAAPPNKLSIFGTGYTYGEVRSTGGGGTYSAGFRAKNDNASNIETLLDVYSSTATGTQYGLPLANLGRVSKTNGPLAVGTESAADLVLGTNNTERVRVLSGGNVGIGTTAPAAKLDVAGKTKTTNFQMTTGAAANTVLTGDGTGNATWTPSTSLAISETDPQVSSAINNRVAKWNGSSLTDGIITDNGTSVGINTSTPVSKLHIDHVSGHGENEFEDHAVQIGGFDGGNMQLLAGADNTAGVSYIQSIKRNVEKSILALNAAGGNVGIGTTTPAAKLDVSGDARINGLTVGRGGGNIGLNTAIGTGALASNTTGVHNTANGLQALIYNSGGHYNTANGAHALRNNTTGEFNTASGSVALYYNTTGSSNTAMGRSALSYNTSGSGNTAVGMSAGDWGTDLTNSSFLGRDAYATSNGLTNVTGVGYDSHPTASNMARVGNSSVTSIGGQVAWTTVSDERYKRNVVEDVKGLDFIMQLRPVTYNLAVNDLATFLTEDMKRDTAGNIIFETDALDKIGRDAKEKIRYTGFLAQEVEKAAKKIGYDFSGVDAPQNDKSLYGLRYAEFTVPLVKAVQELNGKMEEMKPSNLDSLMTALATQQALNEAQQTELAAQKAQIEALERMMREILANQRQFEGDLQQCCFDHSDATGTSTVNQQSTIDNPRLEQNIPNPFHENTTIKYYLPNSTRTANITISDLSGVQLKTFDLSGGKGFGQVLISGGAFAAGTYIYTLTVDGKVVDSKRMVLL